MLMRKPFRRGAELLFQVLTEREERNSVAIASNESFSGWIKTFTDPRLCGRAGWCSPVWSARLLVWLVFRTPTLPGCSGGVAIACLCMFATRCGLRRTWPSGM